MCSSRALPDVATQPPPWLAHKMLAVAGMNEGWHLFFIAAACGGQGTPSHVHGRMKEPGHASWNISSTGRPGVGGQAQPSGLQAFQKVPCTIPCRPASLILLSSVRH